MFTDPHQQHSGTTVVKSHAHLTIVFVCCIAVSWNFQRLLNCCSHSHHLMYFNQTKVFDWPYSSVGGCSASYAIG